MESFNNIINTVEKFINDNNYKIAYDNIKIAKHLINNENDEMIYYNLLFNIIEMLHYKTEAYKICEKIILSNKFSWHFKNTYLNYINNYITSITANNLFKIKLNCPTDSNYHISSPSIIKTNDSYICNLRAINYIYTTNGDYISRDIDGIVRTDNYIVHLDINFYIQSMYMLKPDPNIVIYPCRVMGMEDVRLFGEKYLLCTCLDVTSNHVPKVCFGTYDKYGNVMNMKILGDINKTEKNWLPIYDNNTCKIIYSFYPLIIYDLNLISGELIEIINTKLTAKNLSSFRGSAVPIKYKNGWLCTVHQVYYDKKRKYMHRFLWIDYDFTTIKYSKCFYFEKIGVEFNLGIAHHNNGLILTYSVDDANPNLCIISYDTLDLMLHL